VANSLELAGFPHHALDTYLHKLVRAGHRVAICDQLEDPKAAKGIVKRGVTEMITPGTATNEKMLDGSRNNFTRTHSTNGFGRKAMRKICCLNNSIPIP
jgi:DNA mismatch repair protein MutS